MTGVQRVVICFLRLIANILISYFGYQSFAYCFDESAAGAGIGAVLVTVGVEIAFVTDEFFGFVSQFVA